MKKYPVQDDQEELFFSSFIEKTGYDKIQVVREGIPYYAFENYASVSPLTLADWSELLEISERR